MPTLLFLIVCFVWGASFILMKWSLGAFGVLGVATWRVLLGAAALLVIWRVLQPGLAWTFTRRDLVPMLGISLGGYALPFALQPLVIHRVEQAVGHGSAFAGMMVSFVPLLTILVSIPLLGVKPTRRQIVGVLGGLAALGLLFYEELRIGAPALDLVLGAITPLCYATANTYVKRRFGHVPPLLMSAAAMGLAGGLILGPSLWFESVAVTSPAFAPAALSLAVLGVLCTGVAGYIFYTLIYSHGPLYAGMVAYVIPCVAILIAWVTGETISPGQLAIIAIVFAMVAVVQTGHPPASGPARPASAAPPPVLPAEPEGASADVPEPTTSRR